MNNMKMTGALASDLVMNNSESLEHRDDIRDVEAIASMLREGDKAAAARAIRELDTVVRECIDPDVYEWLECGTVRRW